MRFRPFQLFAILIPLLATLAVAAETQTSDLQKRRDALNALLAEQWDYNLSTAPEFASILGDKRWNDKTSDFSQEAHRQEPGQGEGLPGTLRGDRHDRLPGAGDPQQDPDGARPPPSARRAPGSKSWLMPVTQISGIHLMAPQFPPLLSFASVKDYDDLITRYKQFPKLFDQTIAHMRNGMAAGLMPPKFLLEKVVGQIEGIAAMKPEDSPFAEPLQRFPKGVPAAEQERIRDRDDRHDPRPDPSGLRPLRQVRQGRVRAQGADRGRHVDPARRRGPLRLRREGLDHHRPAPGGDPPDRPARGGADRG